jgi:hypothetical protein
LKVLSLGAKKRSIEQANKNLSDRQRLEQEKQQAEDAVIAEETQIRRKREHLEQQAEDAAIAKRKNLERLRGEIKEATKLLNERLVAWRQAGSPKIQQQALDNAKEKANALLGMARGAKRNLRITSVKIAYLRFAYFTRKTAIRFGMPWFAIAMILGAAAFAVAVAIAFLFTNNPAIDLSLGAIAFLGGFLTTSCLLFLPGNSETQKGLANLTQHRSDQLRPLEAAELAYEEARREHERLASLHKLRTDCEEASIEKQRLEQEYQATCK